MKNWTFRFPETVVPETETTYMCQVFEFPDEGQDYHAVAYEPLIDNQHVMHHIVVYGCDDGTSE